MNSAIAGEPALVNISLGSLALSASIGLSGIPGAGFMYLTSEIPFSAIIFATVPRSGYILYARSITSLGIPNAEARPSMMVASPTPSLSLPSTNLTMYFASLASAFASIADKSLSFISLLPSPWREAIFTSVL